MAYTLGMHDTVAEKKLARALVLDELFDLTLYRRLHGVTTGEVQRVLAELIPVEEKHFAFWQDFFKSDLHRLDFWRRLKLSTVMLSVRLFGLSAIHLVLEAIEVYGIRKYLTLWEAYRDTPLGEATKAILRDELGHEDKIVAQIAARKINPERVRSVFLGFNDGSVEILGAVSGFFAAFQTATSVLVAGSTVAVAGAISMAAGAFVASSSAKEVESIERSRQAFLGEKQDGPTEDDHPFGSSLIVGVSYLIGALIPILPVLFGAINAWTSILVSGIAIILVSFVLAFLSGMKITHRISMNLAIIAVAVGISYLIGLAARSIWGVTI